MTGAGLQAPIGPLEVRTAALDHRVTTFGYRISEPDGISLDADRLGANGITGPDVGTLVSQGWFDTPSGRVTLDQVSTPKPGQSMAFIMDTAPCDGAEELADGVDLLVCESTYLEQHRELATQYRHMTAGQAGALAASAGARRLVLTHFSARYADNQAFGDEAAVHHSDVAVAEDLAVIDVPPRNKAP